MHARISRFAGLPPERLEATVKQFELDQLSQLEDQSGFRGILVLADRRAGKAAAISLWETEADLRASERAAAQAREAAVATAGPTGPDREPVVDHYEVLLEKIPAAAPSG